MADIPTQADLFAAGRREAIVQPSNFTPEILDTPGSDVHVVLQVGAAMGEEVATYASSSLNELSLGTATGTALDRWVWDRYQIRRKDAATAVVTLQLTRTDTSAGQVVPQGVAFASDSGVQYVTQTAVPFAAGQPGPLSVLAVADIAGTAGNTPAGTITTPSTALNPVIGVTNLEPAAGGAAAESDDVFRARARGFWIAARRGTRVAIEYGATQVAQVAQAQAAELFQPSSGLPTYRVRLYAADSAGQGNRALADAVAESLDEYRALGVPVQVSAAVPQYVVVTWSGVLYSAGANTTQVQADIRAATVAAVNALAPGATLRRSSLLAAAQGVQGAIIPEGSLVAPAGDLVPLTGQVVRTTADRVTFT